MELRKDVISHGKRKVSKTSLPVMSYVAPQTVSIIGARSMSVKGKSWTEYAGVPNQTSANAAISMLTARQ